MRINTDIEFIQKYMNQLPKEIYIPTYIQSSIQIRTYSIGEYICQNDTYLDSILIIVDGKAKVSTTLSNGKSLLVAFYGVNSIIGDLEFTLNQKTVTEVKALEEVTTLVIERKHFEDLNNDTLFLTFISQSIANKLIKSTKNHSFNLLLPLENRLCSYIQSTSIIKEGNIKYVSFNESLIEIAEYLGTSYRHLHRTLNLLEKNNIIKKENKRYLIVNESKMKELAQDVYRA